jgi:hypothetical protein
MHFGNVISAAVMRFFFFARNGKLSEIIMSDKPRV